jgi:hypothetical protein
MTKRRFEQDNLAQQLVGWDIDNSSRPNISKHHLNHFLCIDLETSLLALTARPDHGHFALLRDKGSEPRGN